MELQRARGTQDLLPEEAIPLTILKEKLRRIFELYGFNPVDTPAIERFDVLSAKYAGGDEILKETFRLQDQGQRELGLRYDHTVPFARMVGMNPQLKKPFKRYVIDKVWRDGPVSAGRFREFVQCDVDMVGIAGISAETELLLLASRVMETFGLPYVIRVNDRRLLKALFGAYSIPDTQAMVAIDKADKLSAEELRKEFAKFDNLQQLWDDIQQVKDLPTQEKIQWLEKKLGSNEALISISTLFANLSSAGMEKVKLDLALVRGLAFYTATVFEIMLTESHIKSSVGGGGRYDTIIGQFLESKDTFPAIGISFGLSRLLAAMESNQKKRSVTQALVIPIGIPFSSCLPIAEALRSANIRTEVDLAQRPISKNMDYANSLDIPYVLIVGDNELKSNTVMLKDMKSGAQQQVALDVAIRSIQG